MTGGEGSSVTQPRSTGRPLYVEEILWKPREDDVSPHWAGHRNFWLTTDSVDGRHLRQTAGINPIASAAGRRPAVAVFVTPAGGGHRLPWLDEVDLEAGFVRYFGDNKPELGRPAELSPGNKVMLEEMNLYASERREDREKAAPLLFFLNLGGRDGAPMSQFLGFGLVKQAHRVTQLHKGQSFGNYAFDCVLLRGNEDDKGREMIDFSWIDDRRDPRKSSIEALKSAPASWQMWVERGASSVDSRQVRRFVIRGDVWPPADQVPEEDSRLGRVLKEIYRRYDGNYKHGFQALAALATQYVITVPGLTYVEGWITPVGPDGGVDFVQRLDLGKGFSSTRLVVIGQAKCRKPWPISGNGVSAEELARVVARLRRGSIGAYVTTSYFTEAAQRELMVDEYPVVMINGRRLAQVSEELRDSFGHESTKELLDWVDELYVRMLGKARPRPFDIVRELTGVDLPGIAPGGAGEGGAAGP